DHVVVESVPQHGRERAGTELSFVVSPGVAKIIRSEVEDEMSEFDFFGDIMWDIGLWEKRIEVIKRKMKAMADDQGRNTHMKDSGELGDEAMRMVHERMGIHRDLRKLMENSHIELVGLVGGNMQLNGIKRSKIVSMCDMEVANLEQCVSNLSRLRDTITNFRNNLKAKKAAAVTPQNFKNFNVT
ncbi:hypothetical protein EJB05_44031, partial [Eragrostis curvula]